MATAVTIRVNYARTIYQASQLESKADQIRRIARSNLAEAIYHADAGWDGANADLFKAKAETVKEQLVKYAENLDKTAKTIRRVAKRIYDAEMAALAMI